MTAILNHGSVKLSLIFFSLFLHFLHHSKSEAYALRTTDMLMVIINYCPIAVGVGDVVVECAASLTT
jgi:hypothetical protein